MTIIFIAVLRFRTYEVFSVMKYLAFIAFLLPYTSMAQDAVLLGNYKPIREVLGDLDKDGMEEKVVVYDTGDKDDEVNGSDRELIIYKKGGNAWTLWQRSGTAIGNSRDGGMMGDPFQELEIKNGILVITHAGGSSWKWDRTDKYRFQHDRFELIGFTASFGKLCEYWTSFDYNLQTGRVEYKKEYEKCDNRGDQEMYQTDQESFFYKLKSPVTMQDRKSGERKMITPKYKEELYY